MGNNTVSVRSSIEYIEEYIDLQEFSFMISTQKCSKINELSYSTILVYYNFEESLANKIYVTK